MDHGSSMSVVLDLHNLHKVNGIVMPAKIKRMGKGLSEGANGGQGEIGQVVKVNVYISMAFCILSFVAFRIYSCSLQGLLYQY